MPSPASLTTQVPLNASLTVVPVENWRRTQYFDDTRLPWTKPSPNLPNLTAATLYSGLALLESPGISVGRGTDKPFEQIGAPYIDAGQLTAFLSARKIPGVAFIPTTLHVAEDANHYPYHSKTIPGIAFTLVNRNLLDAPELGIEIISALQHLYPQFSLRPVARLIANVEIMQALTNRDDPQKIAAAWAADLAAFRQRREPFLLYH